MNLFAALVAALFVGTAAAQTVKIGVVNTFTGPQAVFGEMTDRAFKLYQKLHEKDLPPEYRQPSPQLPPAPHPHRATDGRRFSRALL